MGPQDGVDVVIRAADEIVHSLGRKDIAFTLIGSGDCYDDLVKLRDELGLTGHVEFTGRARTNSWRVSSPLQILGFLRTRRIL